MHMSCEKLNCTWHGQNHRKPQQLPVVGKTVKPQGPAQALAALHNLVKLHSVLPVLFTGTAEMTRAGRLQRVVLAVCLQAEEPQSGVGLRPLLGKVPNVTTAAFSACRQGYDPRDSLLRLLPLRDALSGLIGAAVLCPQARLAKQK